MDAERRRFWFSVFMGIVIIGSILSLAVNPKGRSKQPVDQNEPANLPLVQFEGHNIDANIEQLTSTYRIYGHTTNYNPSELLARINRVAGIDSVYSPSARYVRDKQNPNKTFFVFDATIKKDYNIYSVLSSLEKQKILSDVGAYRKAMVKIPVKVKLKRLDANITKTVTLDNPFITAVVNLNAEPKDVLKITLYVQLKGNAPVKNTIEAYQEKNISLTPAYISLDLNAPIVALISTVTASKAIAYDGFDVNALRAKLHSFKDVNKVTAELSLQSNRFSVNILDSNLPLSAIVNDLNKFKKKPITKIKRDQNIIVVSFNASSAENYVKAKRTVTSLLQQKGVKFKASDVNALFNTKITFNDTVQAKDLLPHVKDIVAALKKYSVPLAVSDFAQSGYLDINYVTRRDIGIKIPIKKPVSARLNLGHNVGDIVHANVAFYAVRGNILNIGAVEKTSVKNK